MTRKRGEEQTQQENACSQPQRTAKDKGSQVVAEAKLESFAHTPAQTPPKGGQQLQVRTHQRAPSDRKSQGQMTAASGIKSASSRWTEGEISEPEPAPEAGPLLEEEPTLKYVLKFSLFEPCDQLKGIKEELYLVIHDL